MDRNRDCEAPSNIDESLDPERCNELLKYLDGWNIEFCNGLIKLVKHYKFDNFANALLFANHVGNAAELESHHPSIHIEWGGATIRWWSHSSQGLGSMDFVMAARCDELSEI